MLPDAVSHNRRWVVSFLFITMLISVFILIAFWGLIQSDWLYGTYGKISQAQWDQIAQLRDRLLELGAYPTAVRALDDALLLPRPSTEQVLTDLRTAAAALEPAADSEASILRTRLLALISEIQPSDGGSPTPWMTPTGWPTSTPEPVSDPPIA
jgi:hypothetical protein